MKRNIAYLFPGQGAQYPGMGKDFFDHFPTARLLFEEADDQLHEHLSKHIFEGPNETLTRTDFSQPAIFVTSLALLKVLEEQFADLKPTMTAGLSLGEYTALVAANKLSFKDGLKLVQARGKFMMEASEKNRGSLIAVLGMDLDAAKTCAREIPELWIANLNCPDQIVFAGSVKALEFAMPILKERGAKRVIPLNVSGAFHSGLMKSAEEKLKPKLEETAFHTSNIQVVMNVPGDIVEEPREMQDFLIQQVTSTTHWEKGIRVMESSCIKQYIEIGPGKTLVGFNRKIGVNGQSVNVEKIQDLEKIGAIQCS